MYRDSKLRTITKTISWRITATLTTTLLVFLFTGELKTAIEVGLLEMLAKMILYYFHERLWDHLSFGKREFPGFVLWINGIPRSGKTTVAGLVYQKLKNRKLKLQLLDSHDVRPLFPETGFNHDEVNTHIKRVGHLAAMLEKNGVSCIASFVSPFRESREFIRSQANNFIEVHLDNDPETISRFDGSGFYEKAREGEYSHVPGLHFPFEDSVTPELHIDMRNNSPEQAAGEIFHYLKERFEL